MSSGHPRVSCCVPGCGRGTTCIQPLGPGQTWLDTGAAETEWLCPTHWARVPGQLKRRRRALVKQWARLGRRYGSQRWWEMTPGSGPRVRLVRVERTIRFAWARCKAEAGSEVGTGGASLEEELARLGL